MMRDSLAFANTEARACLRHQLGESSEDVGAIHSLHSTTSALGLLH